MDIAFTGLPEQVVAGDTLRLTLRISNPYPYAIRVCGDRSLVMLWKHGRFRVEEFDTGSISISRPGIPSRARCGSSSRSNSPAPVSMPVSPCAAMGIRIGLTGNLSARRSSHHDPAVHQILCRRRFGVFVDFGITYLCKEWLRLNKYLANSLGFLCASTSNYVLNRIWTFHNENPDIAGQYLRFLGIAAVGLVINNLTIYLLHERWKLNFYLAKLFAIGVVTFWNFFMNYFFTF